jgi:GT2 family glycosyltransferase
LIVADVSVVVVSFNTRDVLRHCLTGLVAGPSGRERIELIVVDNASADGSAEMVEAEFPSVRVVRLPENVGWGRAVNRAAELSTAEYLLLINPDAVPIGSVVDDLVGYARANPRHRLYTGRTLRVDGTDDNYSCWGLPSLWSLTCFATGLSTAFKAWALTNPEGLPGYDRRTVREVPAVSGCLLLVERDFFGELGGFDPQYFLYSEDIDLSARARAAGARPVVIPAVTVTHIGGASSTSVGQRVKLLRGKATYVRRRWSPGRARLGLALLTIGVGIRALATAARRPFGQPRPEWVQTWGERRTWRAGWPPVDEPRPSPRRIRPTRTSGS